MTVSEVTDYIANECMSYPYFDHYGDKENVIYLRDDDGNSFKVVVTKEEN